MQKILKAVGLSALLFAVGAGADDSAARFDGDWATVVACAMAAGAVAYSYEFSSSVKNGVLHGEHGIKGAPGWLRLDGQIQPDGSASIAAHGLVGKERAAVGELPPGAPYHYNIVASFSENSGTGHRVNVRRCTVTFSRKSS